MSRAMGAKINDEAYRQQLQELKLAETLEALKTLAIQHRDLQKDFRVLSEKYVITKECAMDAVWKYCPRHSDEFHSMPFCDKYLVESEAQIGDYEVLDVLGEGQFSIVKRCRKAYPGIGHEGTGGVISNLLRTDSAKQYAVKQIAKDKIRNITEVLRVENELHALKLCCPHPNVTQYYDAMHGLNHIYIVTEMLPLDLYDFMDANHSKVDPNMAAVITKEILTGLAHLVDNRIAHMDIKPENILLGFNNHVLQVKLCDFGLCSIMHSPDSTLKEFCGSPGFFAPECYITKRFCGFKADIFSLACVTLELLLPQNVFNDQWLRAYDAIRRHDGVQLGRNLRDETRRMLALVAKTHARSVHDYMSRVLVMLPTDRPSAHEVLGLGCVSAMDPKPPQDRDGAGSPLKSAAASLSSAATNAYHALRSPTARRGSVTHTHKPAPNSAAAEAANRAAGHGSDGTGNGVTSPFLWIEAANMQAAVERIRSFLVRRSSTVAVPAAVAARKQSRVALNFTDATAISPVTVTAMAAGTAAPSDNKAAGAGAGAGDVGSEIHTALGKDPSTPLHLLANTDAEVCDLLLKHHIAQAVPVSGMGLSPPGPMSMTGMGSPVVFPPISHPSSLAGSAVGSAVCSVAASRAGSPERNGRLTGCFSSPATPTPQPDSVSRSAAASPLLLIPPSPQAAIAGHVPGSELPTPQAAHSTPPPFESVSAVVMPSKTTATGCMNTSYSTAGFGTPAILAGCNDPGFDDCLLQSAGYEHTECDIPGEDILDSSQPPGVDPLNAALSKFHTVNKNDAILADRNRKALATPHHHNRNHGAGAGTGTAAGSMAGVGNTGAGHIGAADEHGRRHGLNNLFSLDVLMMAQQAKQSAGTGAGSSTTGGGKRGVGTSKSTKPVPTPHFMEKRVSHNPSIDSHSTTSKPVKVDVRHRPTSNDLPDITASTAIKTRR